MSDKICYKCKSDKVFRRSCDHSFCYSECTKNSDNNKYDCSNCNAVLEESDITSEYYRNINIKEK